MTLLLPHPENPEAATSVAALLMPKEGSVNVTIQAIRELAARLAAEPDPDYKDDWERGYDAGQVAAGRELLKLLEG